MYAITIENRGDARYHATSRGYGFVLGPDGEGANPGDALLAALCACIGHYVRQFVRERGIAPDGFAIEAEADSTPDQARLAAIDVRIDLGRAALDDAARADLLARVERCKIHNTLTAACAVRGALGSRRGARAAAPAAAGGCA
jgi:uncharacterized OsmC-like protein